MKNITKAAILARLESFAVIPWLAVPQSERFFRKSQHIIQSNLWFQLMIRLLTSHFGNICDSIRYCSQSYMDWEL